MPPVGFETTMSVEERPQTYAVDRAGNETGCLFLKAFLKHDAAGVDAVVCSSYKAYPQHEAAGLSGTQLLTGR